MRRHYLLVTTDQKLTVGQKLKFQIVHESPLPLKKTVNVDPNMIIKCICIVLCNIYYYLYKELKILFRKIMPEPIPIMNNYDTMSFFKAYATLLFSALSKLKDYCGMVKYLPPISTNF